MPPTCTATNQWKGLKPEIGGTETKGSGLRKDGRGRGREPKSCPPTGSYSLPFVSGVNGNLEMSVGGRLAAPWGGF